MKKEPTELQPCPPSFYTTIVESEEWKEWREENDRRISVEPEPVERCFDTAESTECGWLSPEHFKAFLDFTVSNRK